MREAVSDVLDLRSREAEGLNRMVAISLACHVVLAALIAIMPAEWRTRPRTPDSAPMMISLGGTVGPDAGGKTMISGRTVQELAPEPLKEMFTRAPASKPPEMVAPAPEAKPAPRPPVKIEKPAERSSTRKPVTGEKVQTGSARVDTGAQAVPFGGLSTAGGGGTGGVRLNVENFCCPEYVETMIQLIRRNWNQNQGVTGRNAVRFTIRRDGMLTNVEVERTSGNPLLDLESRRAVLTTQRLPPLPAQFTPPTLTVYLNFEYQR
ncbi:MAG TPA: TonB family protein [Vicinamibacterales bacterium]|nr:TonB family protein [Vicinamibacterales bacterium]